MLALLSLSVLLGLGCGDDTSSVNVDTGGTGTGSGSGADDITTVPVTSADTTVDGSGSGDTSSVDTTMGVVDDSSTSGVADTGTEDTGTTGGEEPLPGQTQSQLVSSGRTMSSASYTMVYTLGQPTQTQATHTSTNYRLQGGLIGANGSPP